MTPEEEAMEYERIVVASARFFDQLIEEGLTDADCRPLGEAKVAAVLAEAGLVEERRVAALLPAIKARVASGADTDLIYHRERMFRAELPSGPEGVENGEYYKRYAEHYRIGIQRARTLYIDPRPRTPYPTAQQSTEIDSSRFRQAKTLGLAEFAQPRVAEARMPEVVRQQAQRLAAQQAQQAQEAAEAVHWHREQVAAEAKQGQEAAEAVRWHQERVAAEARHQQRQMTAAYQQIPAAYRPVGGYAPPGGHPAVAASAAAHPPYRAAAPPTTVPVPPVPFPRSTPFVPASAGAHAPRASAPFRTPYGTAYVVAPNHLNGPGPGR